MACEYECLMLHCKTKLSSGKRMFSIPDWRMSEERKLLCEIWLEKLRNPQVSDFESLTAQKCRCVCEDHFTADEILHTYFQDEDTGWKPNLAHTILKPGSVPSLGYCPIAKKIVKIEDIKQIIIKSEPYSEMENETKIKANRPKQEFKRTHQPKIIKMVCYPTKAYPVQESVISVKCMEEIKSGKENQHIFPEESNKCMNQNKADNNKTSGVNEEIMAREYECLMLHCKTKLSSGKRMFSIPDWRMSEEKKLLCEIWLKKLRNPKFTDVESLTTTSCSYVCEDHFTADEILHTYFQTENTGCKSNSEHQILKPGAVPSMGYCPIAKKIVNIENIKMTSMESVPCSVSGHETKGRANRSKQNTNQPEVVENISIATETSCFNNCKNAISYPADNEGIAETQVDMAFIKKIRDSFQIKCNRLGNLNVHTVDKTVINDNETEAVVHPEHETTKSMKYLNTDNERDVIPIQLLRMYDTGIDKLNTVQVHDTLSIGNTMECTLRALEYDRKENATLKTIPNDDNIIKAEKQDGFEITSRYLTKTTMDKEVFHMDVGITVDPSGTYLSNVHPYSKSAPVCWYVSEWKNKHNHLTNQKPEKSGNIEIIVKSVINDIVKCIIIEEDFQSTMAPTAKQEKERLEKRSITLAKTIVSDSSLSDGKTDELVDLLTEKDILNDESCRAENTINICSVKTERNQPESHFSLHIKRQTIPMKALENANEQKDMGDNETITRARARGTRPDYSKLYDLTSDSEEMFDSQDEDIAIENV